ncbi:ATP-grasp domain-containing protein [Azohydromonas sediminis]|uniref:ATP-grasp domain-containing protein n=1 Tax=Azohydromonas sediminis TaxID=2259674 RepID=UPI000E65C6B8|nr:ATP-grasp domain-containing protein [Azohydromonas sediminis]
MVAETLVVAALSARTLAESARRGGWRVIALDLFGDVDTRRASARWQPIGDPADARIDPARLAAALADAASQPNVAAWVAGSGFDAPHDAAFAAAGAMLPRLGMAADVVAAVRHPATFFATLDRLGLAHPEVRTTPPHAPAGWLAKDAGGSGGRHIRAAADAGPAPGVSPGIYWQRVHRGTPMSALFLADGRRAAIVGLNRLLVRPLGARPYVYHGAIGPIDAPALRARIAAALDALVPAFGLRGLASLDFLADGEQPVLLEINPRPSDTMALYDALWPAGLLRAHVDALGGRLPPCTPHDASVRGHEIVYAPCAGRVDAALAARLASDRHTHDVPAAGTAFDAGMPVCTVGAEGTDVAGVLHELARRRQAVVASLTFPQELPA